MKALVTGGGGFLGKEICRQLLEAGWQVRSIARSAYPELAKLGVESMQGSICDPQTAKNACSDCDVVFHVAAKAGAWGDYGEYYATNVDGTRNLLAAARHSKVRRFVYTSTPSVVHAGGSIEGSDESLPYPADFAAAYPKTKAIAEKLVLQANGDDFLTVALRPHLIWGPGDNHLIPRIIARAKAGRLAFVGDGSNLVDTTYVTDAARAHLLAAQDLAEEGRSAGKAYFISQGDPRPLGDIVNQILGAAGLSPVTKQVPFPIAYAVGAALEKVYGALGKTDEPPMTRFVAEQLYTAHWYDIYAAERDFGFRPEVAIEAGMAKLKAHLATC